MMKNKQRLFLFQFLIATMFFVLLAKLVSYSFLNDSEAIPFLALNEDLNFMAKSREALLDSLIKTNNLTIDPSDGNDIDRVLKNLKTSKKEKLLLIGSSQMIVSQGEEFWKSRSQIVSSKIKYLTNNKYETYNLSIGGMKPPEKLLIAGKAVSILEPENIIIAMTPWDSYINKVRASLQGIDKKNYPKQRGRFFLKDTGITQNKFEFPKSINTKVTSFLEDYTKGRTIIYSNRTGIQKWLTYKANVFINAKNKQKGFDSTTFKLQGQEQPEYWSTKSQDLNDVSGWDTIERYTGKRSLKIVNSVPQNGLWSGDPIYLDVPSKTFTIEGFSKAENLSGVIDYYAIYLGITFEDGTRTQYYNNLSFKKEDHDWEKVKSTVTFKKNVISIRPSLFFFGGVGSVWFDDIKIIEGNENLELENLIPNFSFEQNSIIRKNASYFYSPADWQIVLNNMKTTVDFLATQKDKNAAKTALLITPFWHYKNKVAYPQIWDYNHLIKEVKKYCYEKNVQFIDASYILEPDNFGLYKNGDNKNKIDVLHFNESGHNVLAKYIIDQLDL